MEEAADAAVGEVHDDSAGIQAPLDFRGAEVLAPMVRASTLPLRLECLRYGARLVYSEETIDRKILDAVKVDNSRFGTTDFVSPKEKVNVFSTCAEERSSVMFQLGTANAALAVQAATVVMRDVRGIDINMGCPKSFSVKGGMGAALLSRPEVASDILKSLRRNLPASCALTCKIRILDTLQKTRDFMQICESSGAEAITVHLRQRDERPASPAHWDQIVPLWDAVRIPVLANGDFFTRRQIDEFWKFCRGKIAVDGTDSAVDASAAAPDWDCKAGPAGVMIARGAMWNPSIFCRNVEPPSLEAVVQRYVRSAVAVNNTYQNTKWVVASMLAGGAGVATPHEFLGQPTKTFNLEMSTSKSMEALCKKLSVDHDRTDFPEQAHTTFYYKSFVVPAHPPPDASRPTANTITAASVECQDHNASAAEGRKRLVADGPGDVAAGVNGGVNGTDGTSKRSRSQ
eukprot:TRINITY_DN42935_c0_g1_i1.p1 TRINITY_DN42935_c0_g1~~TRINITY_DN42935_c0_g1_i1.p1  ORF type:complete len:458 (-),score=75.08 TRINITY_DN42935_c0_g1_i1:41-1414(-)